MSQEIQENHKQGFCYLKGTGNRLDQSNKS